MISLDPATSLVVHPATDLFPALVTGPDFDALLADITANGLKHPIVRTLRGAILDGRRRALACRLTGIHPKYRVHTGNPWAFVITANAHRLGNNNHRAMVAGTVAADPAANLRAKTVARTGTDALKALAATGRVPLTTAARIAGLPIEAQDKFVARIENGGHPRFVGRPGWTGEDPPPEPLKFTQREARYRYVQESALTLMGNSFAGLDFALASAAHGLDPAITPEQAAHWRSDLSRQSKSFRRLMALLLLRERSADDPNDSRSVANDDSDDHAGGSESHGDHHPTRATHR
jgi:hypothetical protein